MLSWAWVWLIPQACYMLPVGKNSLLGVGLCRRDSSLPSETKLSHLLLTFLLLFLRETLHLRKGRESPPEPWECSTYRMIKTWNTRRALLIAFGDGKVVHDKGIKAANS